MQKMKLKYNLSGKKDPGKEKESSGGGLGGIVQSIRAVRAARQEAFSSAQLQAERLIVARERRELQAARDAITLAVNTSSDTKDKDPIVDGAGRAIARIAGKDPRVALGLAAMLQQNAKIANEVFIKMEGDFAEQHNIAERTKQELKARPFRLQAGFLGRLAASVLTGDFTSIGDSVVVDGENARIRNPGDQDVARQVHKLERFHKGELIVSPDPPRWADKLVSFFSMFASDDERGDRFVERIESLVPWGHVAVLSVGRDKPLSRTPTLFPGQKAARLQQIIEDTLEPPVGFSPFIPEPGDGDLLRATARELGIARKKVRRRLGTGLRGKSRLPGGGDLKTSESESNDRVARFRDIMNASKAEKTGLPER